MAGTAPQPDFIKMIVGHAFTCKMRLPAVSDTILEASYQARKNGRSYIAAMDIRNALLDYQIPSDEALQQAFEPRRERGGLAESRFAAILQRYCNTAATGLQ
jgi:hypothetical protein